MIPRSIAVSSNESNMRIDSSIHTYKVQSYLSTKDSLETGLVAVVEMWPLWRGTGVI